MQKQSATRRSRRKRPTGSFVRMGQLGAFEKIRDLALETVRLAELAGDDRLRFKGILSLAKLGNEAGSPLPEMSTFCQLAKDVLSRVTPHDLQEANLQNAIGNLYLNHGEPKKAIEACGKGLAICKHSSVNLETMCASLLGNLASVHTLTHQAAEAIEEQVGPNHPDIAWTLSSIGEAYSALNNQERALEFIDRALKIREAALGPDSAVLSETLRSRGAILTSLGRLSASERDLRRAYDIAQRVVPGTPRSLTTSLSSNLLRQGRAEEALVEVHRSSALAPRAITARTEPRRSSGSTPTDSSQDKP